MKIWIDADACPKDVKQIVFRAAERLSIETCLVANTSLPTPRSELITSVIVPGGFDVADEYIAGAVTPGDIVITADIPLAAAIVDKGAVAIDPRGELYDESNAQQRLATRNFMMQMRDSGLVQGGPPPFGSVEKHKFAAILDRLLTQRTRPSS